MAKTWRKATLLLATAMLMSTAVGSFAGCKDGNGDASDSTPVAGAVYKKGTYRTFTSVLPSNWNELTYQDNNDTQILNYIGSSFFEYDYEFDEAKGGKFNADGSINAEAIVPGSFTTNYAAATKLEDVTASVDAKWGYTEEQKESGSYAWKITLREDLKWNDGTPIEAADFVYSMQEQLNPDFMNYRADTYYNNIFVKNAKAYLFSETDFTYESIASLGYATNQAAIDDGQLLYVDMFNAYGAEGAPKITSFDENTMVPVLDYENTCAQWVPYNDDAYYFDYGYFVQSYEEPTFFKEDGSIDIDAVVAYNATAADEDKVAFEDFFFSAAMVYGAYGSNLFEVGAEYASCVSIKVENTNKVTDFANVGLYSPSKYELVLCMDAPIQALKEDGSLSYLAAYYLSSLPLVKKDLYEECKKSPAEGSDLWTTNYNSTLDTSASWGPYKLTQFQGGKSYTLERNDNWYGYGLEGNKNQYNVTKIECEVVAEPDTQWMGFLSGKYDSIGIDTDHLEYVGSKYAIVNYGSTAYGIQIYSNLEVLKENDRNNGILAIQDFRKALSLGMDRADFNLTVFGTLPPSYGLIGEGFFSDVENGEVYRETEQAKKVLLRTYGFTELDGGKWTDGTNSYATLDDAYDAMNGYNPTEAKKLFMNAYNELTANAEKYGYDASKDITLLYGATNTSETSTKKKVFMQKVVDELAKDTPLEGKIKVEMDAKYSSTWADSYREGLYDLCIVAGIGGNVFNPFSLIGAFVNSNDSLKYAAWWDTSTETMTYTMPAGDYAGAGETHTMTLDNWFFCLNGNAEAQKQAKTYNWGAGVIPHEARLELLAHLEEVALSKFFQIQCSFDAEMALDSAKFANISEEYNTFMGYGGIRYYIVNYTDAEWNAFVSANGNNLENEYKKEA